MYHGIVDALATQNQYTREFSITIQLILHVWMGRVDTLPLLMLRWLAVT